jgi:hypothetical protein
MAPGDECRGRDRGAIRPDPDPPTGGSPRFELRSSPGCEEPAHRSLTGATTLDVGAIPGFTRAASSPRRRASAPPGLPLIAFRHTSYEHIETEKAGVLIDRIEDLPSAVETLLRDYDNYVGRAYACFRKHYCFEENFVGVLNSLRAIAS